MEQKRVSFKVAKAIKDAGYWNPNTTINSQYNNACYAKNGRLYPQGCVCDWEDVFPAPTYLDVWLWLCKIKGFKFRVYYNGIHERWFCEWSCYSQWGADTEEAIIAAIDYLVDNDLIK